MYIYLLSLHPFPCNRFPSLSPQNPQGTEHAVCRWRPHYSTSVCRCIRYIFCYMRGKAAGWKHVHAEASLLCLIFSLWNTSISHGTGKCFMNWKWNDHTVVLLAVWDFSVKKTCFKKIPGVFLDYILFSTKTLNMQQFNNLTLSEYSFYCTDCNLPYPTPILKQQALKWW